LGSAQKTHLSFPKVPQVFRAIHEGKHALAVSLNAYSMSLLNSYLETVET
jgi:hypothetical protein